MRFSFLLLPCGKPCDDANQCFSILADDTFQVSFLKVRSPELCLARAHILVQGRLAWRASLLRTTAADHVTASFEMSCDRLRFHLFRKHFVAAR